VIKEGKIGLGGGVVMCVLRWDGDKMTNLTHARQPYEDEPTKGWRVLKSCRAGGIVTSQEVTV